MKAHIKKKRSLMTNIHQINFYSVNSNTAKETK